MRHLSYLLIGLIMFQLLIIGCNDATGSKKEETKESQTSTDNNGPILPRAVAEKYNSDTISSFPIDTLLHTKVLTAGIFHDDEVWSSAGKEKWFGLYKGKEGFYLSQTLITTERVHDEVIDENERAKTGWRVRTNNKDSNYILIENLPYLVNRKIQNFPLPVNFIYPGDTIKFTYLSKSYKMFATGTVHKTTQDSDPESSEVLNYRLFLSVNINGVLKTQLLVARPDFDEKMIELIFAGDIDGDGLLDLIIDTSRHYNMESPTLYLSKPASDGKIIEPMGVHIIVGC